MARLNIQGLARRDRELMSCIRPDPGYVTVSIDLSAGEPTVTAHFSQDPNYRYATFEGVGKRPEYRNGILMVDDLYVMTRSVSPLSRTVQLAEFNNKRFNDRTWADQWLTDSEVIKKSIKVDRDLHKMLALALGYGMGPRKMVKQCYDKGHEMPFPVAKAFFNSYWQLFAGVRRFADRLALQIKKKGYIVNPFGYRLTPPPQKAFNFFIQSSVSGIMHVFNAKLFALAPYARFISVIHDELICDVPIDMLDKFRKAKEDATQSLNEDLRWSVAVRTGFAPGSNWYEAK
jgi:DNA polymerase I-like protein with 3'-5' exonuclease and polymerase domains